MRPWMTNMQSVARDAHAHIFASTGALAFANEHLGSAAPPAPYNAFAERQHTCPCSSRSHPSALSNFSFRVNGLQLHPSIVNFQLPIDHALSNMPLLMPCCRLGAELLDR